jgi:RNA recognition motif-containing protein
MFAQFGQVASSQIVIDRDTNRSRGFGFVEMPADEEAAKAIGELNGQMLKGRALR